MKKIPAFLIILASSSLNAATWFTGSIDRVYPLANGNFVIIFKEDSPACTSINASKYHYVNSGNNGLTPEGLDKIYSLALTAATTGKKLSINFDETESACYVNRAYISF